MKYQKNKLAALSFAWLMKFSTWLQNLPARMTPPPFRLLQLGSAFWQSRVLYVAVRLDIATVLADETLAADDIAGRVAAQPDAIYRLLRMLSAMGIFEQASSTTFRNNKTSDFLRDDKAQNIRALILMHNSPEMSLPWYEYLEAGVKNGAVPFRLAHQQELFAYMTDHPEFSSLFARAMDSVEALSGDSFATDFDWQRFDRVFDIGGSKGSKALTILKHQPHLKALVIDAVQVISEAEKYWPGKADESLLSRLRFEVGDVLESVPGAASDKDIYLLSAVLHGFDDETAVKALTNIASAIKNTGARIAVMDMVVDELEPDFVSTSFDMQMFMGTRGRERTLREWQALFSQSGLVLEEQVILRGFGSILVLAVNAASA